MTHTTTHAACPNSAPAAPMTEPAPTPTTPATPPTMSAPPITTHGLEWLGPLAFTRRHAGGVDRDFGDQWGRLGDQRLTVRHQLGTDHGLLYVYDDTWGEYAVLADDVPLAAVHEATALAAATDPHMNVTHVTALATRHLSQPPPATASHHQPETPRPSPWVEL